MIYAFAFACDLSEKRAVKDVHYDSEKSLRTWFKVILQTGIVGSPPKYKRVKKRKMTSVSVPDFRITFEQAEAIRVQLAISQPEMFISEFVISRSRSLSTCTYVVPE